MVRDTVPPYTKREDRRIGILFSGQRKTQEISAASNRLGTKRYIRTVTEQPTCKFHEGELVVL